MRPSIALEKNRQVVRDVVSKFRTTNPRIFGSVLHNTDKEDSDLDILVDALPHTNLLDLGDLHHELINLLGISVDVLTPEDLHIQFRAQLLAEAQPV